MINDLKNIGVYNKKVKYKITVPIGERTGEVIEPLLTNQWFMSMESLAKDGKESTKKQSMKDRRDESKGMEKSKGKGAYSSDPGMSRKSSPANMSKKAAERKVAKGKGRIEGKVGGKDPDFRYVSNRRQERASKAMKEGGFKGITKASKIKNKARKIK